MSIEGQGHFFIIYFPGIVCFVLYLANISGERLQDYWSSGLLIMMERNAHNISNLVYCSVKYLFCFKLVVWKLQEVPQ